MKKLINAKLPSGEELTQERLKECLHYDPETGVFTWLKRTAFCTKVGTEAGSVNQAGYRRINIYGKAYKAHRLVFLYMEGEFPPDEVDHINRVRTDNRWCNLRHASRHSNCANKINNTAFIGVQRWQGDRWQAMSPWGDGKRKYLGLYKTHIAACYARWAHDKEIDELKRGL